MIKKTGFPSIIKIFDFDLTLTKHHTFQKFQLTEKIDAEKGIEEYLKGKKNAENILKNSANVHFQFDKDHISTVATYHNNPDFVAGVLSKLLNKELTYVSTVEESLIAIKRYKVEGEDTPLFISYIPAVGLNFPLRISLLDGKNQQILMLRETLLAEKLITSKSILQFYDDDIKNFNEAAQLDFLDRYLVERETPEFIVSKQELHKSPPISANLFFNLVTHSMAKKLVQL